MRDENPVMTFPIKKRINTELFIDKRASLYIQKRGARKIRTNEKGGKCWHQRTDKGGNE